MSYQWAGMIGSLAFARSQLPVTLVTPPLSSHRLLGNSWQPLYLCLHTSSHNHPLTLLRKPNELGQAIRLHLRDAYMFLCLGVLLGLMGWGMGRRE